MKRRGREHFGSPSTLVAFRIPTEDLDRVDDLAARLGTTRSDVVRIALRSQLAVIPIINPRASSKVEPERLTPDESRTQ
jgi:hypothetical protein